MCGHQANCSAHASGPGARFVAGADTSPPLLLLRSGQLKRKLRELDCQPPGGLAEVPLLAGGGCPWRAASGARSAAEEGTPDFCSVCRRAYANGRFCTPASQLRFRRGTGSAQTIWSATRMSPEARAKSCFRECSFPEVNSGCGYRERAIPATPEGRIDFRKHAGAFAGAARAGAERALGRARGRARGVRRRACGGAAGAADTMRWTGATPSSGQPHCAGSRARPDCRPTGRTSVLCGAR
jgi:hypothetical protein